MCLLLCYITNFKARITEVLATVTEDMLENTWREIVYRLDFICATKEAHIASVLMCCKQSS
jgi:hypothetical protein